MRKSDPSRGDPARRIKKRDTLARIGVDVIDATLGAAAGATFGALGGPVGAVAGAAAGAAAGTMLGEEVERLSHENALRDRAIDDIDVVDEFFGTRGALGNEPPPAAPEPLTEVLEKEHQVILRVLEAFDAWAEDAFDHRRGDKSELGRFVTFFREFVDGCHHGKEERVFFGALVDQGVPGEAGPVLVLTKEHEQGRADIRALEQFASLDRPWTSEDRLRIFEIVRGYATRLRLHILKENRILFPMAAARLPSDSQAVVRAGFERFEREQVGEGGHERLHALAEALIAAHGT